MKKTRNGRRLAAVPSTATGSAPVSGPLAETAAPPARAPLAVLTGPERNQVGAAQALVHQAEQTLELLRHGLVLIWREIGARHGLPAQFDYDPVSGVVVPRAEATGGG